MRSLQQGLEPADVDISYLRNRLDFEEVLEGLGIEVSHTLGDWIMCHCPNPAGHSNGDMNPSFGFNAAELRYNCFVCGGGTLLELVKDQLEVDDQGAANWLREHSTFEPAQSSNLVEKINKIIHPVDNTEILPEYPDSAVFKYKFVHPYLLERGISKDVIIEMNVGFDEDHLGIVFPHYWQGKLRGWQVRHLLTEKVNDRDVYYCPTCGESHSPTVAKKPKEVAKYNNTVGFPKKTTLYNYDNMKGSTEIYVVESPMTVLKLKTFGINNVVATFGSFNKEQVPYLVKHKVLLWPDNDPAGLENLRRIIVPLRNQTEVYVIPAVNIPKGDAGDLHDFSEIEYFTEHKIAAAKLPFYENLPTLDRL